MVDILVLLQKRLSVPNVVPHVLHPLPSLLDLQGVSDSVFVELGFFFFDEAEDFPLLFMLLNREGVYVPFTVELNNQSLPLSPVVHGFDGSNHWGGAQIDVFCLLFKHKG